MLRKSSTETSAFPNTGKTNITANTKNKTMMALDITFLLEFIIQLYHCQLSLSATALLRHCPKQKKRETGTPTLRPFHM